MISSKALTAIFCSNWYQSRYLLNDPYFDSPLEHYYKWGISCRLAPNKWLINANALKLLNDFDENDEPMLLHMKVNDAISVGALPGICNSFIECIPSAIRLRVLNISFKEFLFSYAKEIQIDVNLCRSVLGLPSKKIDESRVLVLDILNEYASSSQIPYWFEREAILECNPDLSHLDNESLVSYLLENLKFGRQLDKFDMISPKSYKCLQRLKISKEKNTNSIDDNSCHSIEAGVAGIVIGSVLYQNPTHEIKRFLGSLLSAVKILKNQQPNVKIKVCIKLNSSFNDADMQIIENFIINFREEDCTMQILAFTENLGFGGGHNEIVINNEQHFENHLYLCINPDGSLFPTSLLVLCDTANKIGIHSGIFEALQLPKRHPKYFCPSSYETAWASGACFAISLKNYQLLKGFDERFFMYCEDVDLSLRARLAGIRCYTLPDFCFWHDTTSRNDQNREAQMRLSAMELFKKFGLTEEYLKQLKLIESIPIKNFLIDNKMYTRKTCNAYKNKFHSNHKLTQNELLIIGDLFVGDLHFSPAASHL